MRDAVPAEADLVNAWRVVWPAGHALAGRDRFVFDFETAKNRFNQGAEVYPLWAPKQDVGAQPSPIASNAPVNPACRSAGSEIDLRAGFADGALSPHARSAQDALLPFLEARLADEVRWLIGALAEFAGRAELIGEEIPDDAKFCKSVTGALRLFALQLAYSFGKGLDKPVFLNDGREYLAGLGLSLDELVREVSLEGRQFLAIALVDQQPADLGRAADAFRE